MMHTAQAESADTCLVISRTFNAPREHVFKAWTETEHLKNWFGPEGVSVPTPKVDLRVGGEYIFAMHTAEGEVVNHSGTYREIRYPEKLVFTWNLEDQSCAGSEGENCETLVTIEFIERGKNSTEIVLTHEFLPSEQSRDGHEMGWNSSFDCLEKFL